MSDPRNTEEIQSRIMLIRSEIRTARPSNVETVCNTVKERMATQVILGQLNKADLVYLQECVSKLPANVEELQRMLAVQRYVRKFKLPVELAIHNVEFLHSKGFQWWQIP